MSTLTKIKATELAEGLKAGRLHLIDIREADEHAREHIPGAVLIPLSRLEEAHVKIEADCTAVFHCKSCMRTEKNCDRLAARIDGDAYILDGGMDAWKQAGFPVASGPR